MKIWSQTILAGVMFLLPGGILAQENLADRISVPFSNSVGPRLLKASLIDGDITVRTHSGNEVIVESRPQKQREEKRNKKAAGLRRLQLRPGFSVEESDNVVTVSVKPNDDKLDLLILVPAATSLKLNTIDGDVVVEAVTGEIEAHSTDGNVRLTQVSGSVVAHSVDGDVVASFARVAPDKAMSFSTLDGDIDVTFPPDLKARVKVEVNDGEVYTDFDIQLDRSSQQPKIEEGQSGRGRRVRLDKGVVGTINGGGPEFQFKSFDGDIYLRKAGSNAQ